MVAAPDGAGWPVVAGTGCCLAGVSEFEGGA
jgi:hypothetical protein